jgi:hypothetical protein
VEADRRARLARTPGRGRGCTAAAIALLILAGCGGAQAPSPAPQARGESNAAASDTAGRAVVEPPPPTRRAPSYRSVAITGARRLSRLGKSLGVERLTTVLKVNRVDLTFVHPRDTLSVPDSSTMALDSIPRMLALAPFPLRLEVPHAPAKLLFVSLRVQAFAAYDSGRLTRWGPTSTGRETLQTPVGLYHANWKARERTSTFNEEWLLKWYINLESFLGISLHQFELPGHPASHACVRLMEDDAMWLYDWVEQWRIGADPRVIVRHGTPVVIFGRYAYHEPPPWHRLGRDSTATHVTPTEIDEALDLYLPPVRASGPAP